MPAIPIVAAVAGAAASKMLNKGNDAAAQRAQDAAAKASTTQAGISQDQWDSYKATYQPMEKQFALDAQNYDTFENRELAAGEASATVASQFGKMRDRLGRTPGLDPSSAAYTAARSDLELRQAAVDANSQNAARNRVQDTAWARRSDAISLGKGLSAQASIGLSNAANTNMQMANTLNANSAQNGAAIGSLVSRGLDAYDKYRSQTPATPVVTPVNTPTPNTNYGPQ